MSDKKKIALNGFSTKLSGFVSEIVEAFPGDIEIATLQKTIGMIESEKIIGVWKEFVTDKYADVILKGDIEFFFNKDYSDDLASVEKSKFILDKIDQLRDSVKKMAAPNREKAMKHIQNLTALSKVYFS